MRQPTTPPNKPILIMVTDTLAVYWYNGSILTSEIQPDQEGELYYFVGSKAHYLPKELQLI